MTTTPHETMRATALEMAERCKLCKFCNRECAFLDEYGMPGELAGKLLEGELDPAIALQCSNCGLCTQVCTVRGLDPAAMFTAMREVALAENPDLTKPYEKRLAHERAGVSDELSFFGVPEGATALLFPGCAMSGARPGLVWDCFLKLREADERLGLALHCCAHASDKLGLADLHHSRMADILVRIEATGVREVLVMCPSCLTTLKAANPSFEVRTVYEVLAGLLPEAPDGMERVRTGVHDPCVLRAERAVHQAVRDILWKTGSSVTEMRHSMHKALCCGQGAAVETLRPDFAEAWRDKRAKEAVDRRVATYCADCMTALGRDMETVHVLDLALGREPLAAAQWPQGPETYGNRRTLKKQAEAFFAGC